MSDTPITDKAFRAFSGANLERVYTIRGLRELEETVRRLERRLNAAKQRCAEIATSDGVAWIELNLERDYFQKRANELQREVNQLKHESKGATK